MVIVAAERVKHRSAHRLRIPYLPDGRTGGWVTWKGEGEDRLALHDDNAMAAPKSKSASVEEYVVVVQSKLRLRKGVETTSPETGSLSSGEKVVALEHAISSQGHKRMRTPKG
jgi:hypothetical protein